MWPPWTTSGASATWLGVPQRPKARRRRGLLALAATLPPTSSAAWRCKPLVRVLALAGKRLDDDTRGPGAKLRHSQHSRLVAAAGHAPGSRRSLPLKRSILAVHNVSPRPVLQFDLPSISTAALVEADKPDWVNVFYARAATSRPLPKARVCRQIGVHFR